jgi:hypothetical protein
VPYPVRPRALERLQGQVPWLGYHAPATGQRMGRDGRGDWIRTSDFLSLPKRALYQAELRPVDYTFIPAKVNRRLASMAIRTTDHALCDLYLNTSP